MSYFFSTPVDIDIVLDEPDDRTMVDVKLDKNRREKAPLYMDGESVKGAVTVRPKDGKRLEHTGIKVQFIGTIGTQLDHYDQQQSSIFRRRRRRRSSTSSSSPYYYYSSSSSSSSLVSGALGLLTPQWTLPSIRLGLQQRQQKVTDGLVEMFFDRGNHYEFLSLNQELAAPGELQHPQTFDFNFKNVEKQYESYNGINVKLRYFVRVTVSRRMADVIREKDIWVYSYRIPPEMNSSIKMDVGIEDCLHIEFEYSKSKYHLKDVIVGRIYFLLVRLKIKHMELSIIRRETTGAAPNQYNESETLVRFEIMDGSPSRGETIPIRLFLGGFDLTPTFRDVNKKFSTRYYLSLVLIDEDARRYFKQSEIILYRQAPDAPAVQGAALQSLPPPPENKIAPAAVQA
ncbi:vacuolar protein sorting-associated protein 26 domain-containing protein [Trichoderma sp. TUCIM 5745]